MFPELKEVPSIGGAGRSDDTGGSARVGMSMGSGRLIAPTESCGVPAIRTRAPLPSGATPELGNHLPGALKRSSIARASLVGLNSFASKESFGEQQQVAKATLEALDAGRLDLFHDTEVKEFLIYGASVTLPGNRKGKVSVIGTLISSKLYVEDAVFKDAATGIPSDDANRKSVRVTTGICGSPFTVQEYKDADNEFKRRPRGPGQITDPNLFRKFLLDRQRHFPNLDWPKFKERPEKDREQYLNDLVLTGNLAQKAVPPILRAANPERVVVPRPALPEPEQDELKEVLRWYKTSVKRDPRQVSDFHNFLLGLGSDTTVATWDEFISKSPLEMKDFLSKIYQSTNHKTHPGVVLEAVAAWREHQSEAL